MTALTNKVALLVCTLLLVGCMTNKKIFVPVLSSVEKGSVVYIYRPTKAANVMLTPQIKIAGINPFGISSGNYKQLYLTPGQHVIKLAAIEGNTTAVEHALEVVKGQVYYLRIDASMKLEFGRGYQPYKRKFELLEVRAEKAVTEIVDCSDMDTSRKQKKFVESGQVENEKSVFSTDKTANPFSR